MAFADPETLTQLGERPRDALVDLVVREAEGCDETVEGRTGEVVDDDVKDPLGLVIDAGQSEDGDDAARGHSAEREP